jgi:ABC-type branched-subunit amino acid transport system substrate-binding protein
MKSFHISEMGHQFFHLRGQFLWAEDDHMKRLFTTILLLTISLLPASCAAASYNCTDPLGCLEIPPGSPVVIGAILATSGQNGPVGTESLQVVEKAVADKDTLLGHSIKLYRLGTDCTADSAREAATEFATYAELSALLGPSCPAEKEIAGPILLDAGIPLLSPVPDSATAYEMVNQILAAIEQVAVRMPDEKLYIPRQALFDTLHISR